jgi:hypothetical protein
MPSRSNSARLRAHTLLGILGTLATYACQRSTPSKNAQSPREALRTSAKRLASRGSLLCVEPTHCQ